MPFRHPTLKPPGDVVRVRRPHHDHRTSCHCTINVGALVGDVPGGPLPLSRCQLHELQSALPQRFQTAPWECVFDTAVDGFSLTHFYRNLESREDAGICVLTVAPRTDPPVLQAEIPSSSSDREARRKNLLDGSPPSMGRSRVSVATSAAATSEPSSSGLDGHHVHRTARGVIGCFTAELPNLRHNPHHFYGSRETFVYNISSHNGGVHTHHWSTGENEEFLISSHHFLGIGGGQDGAAIFLDEDLQFGTSSVFCPTFGCGPLFGRTAHGLHHSEYVIIRMVWFALHNRKHSEYSGDVLRVGSPQIAKLYALTHDTEPSACECGRNAHCHNCLPV